MNAPYDDIQIFVLEFSDSCRRNEKIIGGALMGLAVERD